MSIILFLSLLITNWFSEPLVVTEVAEGITMGIPADFRPMTDDEIASKYFTTKRPLALLTDMSGNIDLGVNVAVTSWKEEDIEMMKSFQKSNIFSLFDEVKILQEGSKEINGRKYAFMEFVSVVNADENSIDQSTAISKYTFIQYVIVNDKSLVFNFTCPAVYQAQWQPIVAKIMDSIVIKKLGK